MKSSRLILILIPLIWVITSCSGGSESGGGVQIDDINTGTFDYSDRAYLEGTWNFSANSVSSDDQITGSLTFNNSEVLTGFENSRCPGYPILSAQWWYLGGGVEKGRVFGFCNSDTYIKFGIQFSDKANMSGDMDVHYDLLGADATYERYSITLSKVKGGSTGSSTSLAKFSIPKSRMSPSKR